MSIKWNGLEPPVNTNIDLTTITVFNHNTHVQVFHGETVLFDMRLEPGVYIIPYVSDTIHYAYRVTASDKCTIVSYHGNNSMSKPKSIPILLPFMNTFNGNNGILYNTPPLFLSTIVVRTDKDTVIDVKIKVADGDDILVGRQQTTNKTAIFNFYNPIKTSHDIAIYCNNPDITKITVHGSVINFKAQECLQYVN